MFLPQPEFESALRALPLVSVDWVLTNPAGELLVGQRLNAPARDTWFTPGGRVRKGECLAQALLRTAQQELGLIAATAQGLCARGVLMGAWDHLYTDSAFSPTEPTHYVNLPHFAACSAADVQALRLPVGEQHARWQWLPLAQAAQQVHPHVRPYVAWCQAHRF